MANRLMIYFSSIVSTLRSRPNQTFILDDFNFRYGRRRLTVAEQEFIYKKLVKDSRIELKDQQGLIGNTKIKWKMR